jgi:hypothetical protein
MVSVPAKVLINYSYDSPEHEQRVLELADRLRADCIDCTIGQYVVTPAQGWPRWMDKMEFRLRGNCVHRNLSPARYGRGRARKGLGVRRKGPSDLPSYLPVRSQ